jgi:sodium-dependent dicarboxylate transporter 2/3/5
VGPPRPPGLSRPVDRRPLLRRPGLWVGLFLALAAAVLLGGMQPGRAGAPGRAAAVVVLMASFWFAEVLPIGATALLPLLLFPFLGVFEGPVAQGAVQAAAPYLDAYIFLFLGGMMIGAAMEATGLHRRTALWIMRAVGTSPRRLLLGILLATGSISAFVSNTATAVMMVPIALALVAELEVVGARSLPALGTSLLLAVAYGANVGGIGTKIGTGTNSIFAGLLETHLGVSIGFLEFMLLGVPFVILFLPLVWAVLWHFGRRDGLSGADARTVVEAALRALGPMRPAERKVMGAFLFAALFWTLGDVLREPLAAVVEDLVPGLRLRSKHYEALVALTGGLAVLAMGVLPLRRLGRLPWSTLLLLGGSFAMAAGVEGSGLSDRVSSALSGLTGQPLYVQVLATSALSVGMSAVASNTATVNVLLNVLPRSFPLWAGAAIGASCDFMLPAGTPPNAIVFGSGRVRIRDMMRIGAGLDLLAVAVIPLWVLAHGALFA